MVCSVRNRGNFSLPWPVNPTANFPTTMLIILFFGSFLRGWELCSVWCNISRDMGKKRKVCPKMVCRAGKQSNFRRPLPDNLWTNFYTTSHIRFVFSRSFQWSFFCSIWFNISRDMVKKRKAFPNIHRMARKQRKVRRPLPDDPWTNYNTSWLIRFVI